MKRFSLFSGRQRKCHGTSRGRRTLSFEGLEGRMVMSGLTPGLADAAAVAEAQPPVNAAAAIEAAEEAKAAVNFNDALTGDGIGAGLRNPCDVPGLPAAPGEGAGGGSFGGYDPGGNAMPRGGSPIDGRALDEVLNTARFEEFLDAFQGRCDNDWLNGMRDQYGKPAFDPRVTGAGVANGDTEEWGLVVELSDPSIPKNPNERAINNAFAEITLVWGLDVTDMQFMEDGGMVLSGKDGLKTERTFIILPDGSWKWIVPGGSNSLDGNGPAGSAAELRHALRTEIGAGFYLLDNGRVCDPRMALLGGDDGVGLRAGSVAAGGLGGSVAMASPALGGGLSSPVVGSSGGARPIDPDPNAPGGPRSPADFRISGSIIAKWQVIDPIDRGSVAATR